MIYTASTDLELVRLIREDDRKAFAELYQRYAMLLLNHAYHRLHSREDAKDVVQEVFAMVWRRRQEVIITKHPSAFLYRSVRNIILNQIAHRQVAGKYNAHIASMEQFANQSVPLADHLIREKQLAFLIESEIARLTPRMREVFELSRKEHLSHQEIAMKLGISEQTVSKHITTALKMLRSRLGLSGWALFLSLWTNV